MKDRLVQTVTFIIDGWMDGREEHIINYLCDYPPRVHEGCLENRASRAHLDLW